MFDQVHLLHKEPDIHIARFAGIECLAVLIYGSVGWTKSFEIVARLCRTIIGIISVIGKAQVKYEPVGADIIFPFGATGSGIFNIYKIVFCNRFGTGIAFVFFDNNKITHFHSV